MAVHAGAVTEGRASSRLTREVLGVVAFLAATVLGALLIVVAGPGIVFMAAGLVVVGLVLVYPRACAVALATTAIVVEPLAVDPSKVVARIFYHFPRSIEELLPFRFDPFEALLGLILIALLFHPRYRPRLGMLPRLAFLVPVVMVVGILPGLTAGSIQGLLWHDLRGLVFAVIAFLVTLGFAREGKFPIEQVILAGVGGLAVVTLGKYFIWADPDNPDVAYGLQFAHESGVLFGTGFTLAAVRLLQPRPLGQRLAYLAYDAVVMGAMMASGRRAAMLCLFACALVLLWLLLPRRPLLISTLGMLALFGGGWLVSSQWDAEGGLFSEPVRAIRSQFDPSMRDASSDAYRDVERENILRTLQEAPLLGVGFGQEYHQYDRRVPVLTDWDLQLVTPHQSVLWLWLKMGLAGAAVFLGLWAIALRRCLSACRLARRNEIPAVPIVTAAVLVMAILFASVDVGVATRFTAVFAAAVAVGLTIPDRARTEKSSGANA
jgi:hypothetical protein